MSFAIELTSLGDSALNLSVIWGLSTDEHEVIVIENNSIKSLRVKRNGKDSSLVS